MLGLMFIDCISTHSASSRQQPTNWLCPVDFFVCLFFCSCCHCVLSMTYSRNNVALQNSHHGTVWTFPGSDISNKTRLLMTSSWHISIETVHCEKDRQLRPSLSSYCCLLNSPSTPRHHWLTCFAPVARISAVSSRETWPPGRVSAPPRLKSLHKCDLYWLIHETACPLRSFCPQSCACCTARASNTKLLLVARETEGSFGSGPARRSFCLSIQLSHFLSAVHLITFTGWTGVVISHPDPSKSRDVNYCF